MSSDKKPETEKPSPAASADGDPYLLTPGPLTTSRTVKQAMLHDYGSRDSSFIELNQGIRTSLLQIANATESHECIPLQGSGTFAVEAMLASLLSPDAKLLVLVNGAYGRRIAEICCYLRRPYIVEEVPEDQLLDPVKLDRTLAADYSITHVALVYCETTSGILNPLAELAAVVASHGRALLIDAMSAFGALPVDARAVSFAGLAASSNKCLQGVPGMGFCLVNKKQLPACEGNSHSLSLDLFAQVQSMNNNGQWRFTPPVHCLLALAEALRELDREGGVAARAQRYSNNCRILLTGMRELGFESFLNDALQAPIIVTFKTPTHPRFDFQQFYTRLAGRGYIIYPGKITSAETFRIGCIGALDEAEMYASLAAIRASLEDMHVKLTES